MGARACVSVLERESVSASSLERLSVLTCAREIVPVHIMETEREREERKGVREVKNVRGC